MIDVDKVILLLVDLATAACPDEQVIDGWNLSDELEGKFVCIGQPPAQDAPAVSVRVATDEGGLCADQYDVAVHCSAAVWDGDEYFGEKRKTVQQIMSALGAAVKADRSLGGNAFSVDIAPELDWFQISDPRGTSVQVDFTFAVRVYG